MGEVLGFDDLFWLTLLVLFLSGLVSALLRRFRRNACLKLFDNHHVTYLNAVGKPLWGDLFVSSQGVELVYDAPYTTSRGLVKGSHLVAQSEVTGCLALCRTVHALTAEEQEARLKQIERTFAPGFARRSLRKCRNFADMMRDAIANSLGLFMGAVGGRFGAAVTSRKAEVGELSKTLVGTVANAYEPLLERHIGKPVVLQCSAAPGAAEEKTEFIGYLVEYTQDFIAVFNVEQKPEERLELQVSESLERDGLRVQLTDDRITFTCIGPNAVIVRNVATDEQRVDLDVTLFPGSSLGVNAGAARPVSVQLELTHQLDLVCPRANAQVRFSSTARAREDAWQGVAPDSEAAES